MDDCFFSGKCLEELTMGLAHIENDTLSFSTFIKTERNRDTWWNCLSHDEVYGS